MDQNAYTNNEEEIELKELIKIVADEWKLIAKATGIIAIAVLLMSLATYFIKPPITYSQAFSTVEVIASEGKDQQAVAFMELAKSETVAQRTVDALKLNVDGKALSDRVLVSKIEDTNSIQIGIADVDGNWARQVANSIREESVKIAEGSMNLGSITVTQSASISDQTIQEKSPVNFVLNTVIAAILTIMATIFFIFFKRYLNDKVQTIEEVENRLGIKVIGVIPNKQN